MDGLLPEVGVDGGRVDGLDAQLVLAPLGLEVLEPLPDEQELFEQLVRLDRVLGARQALAHERV